MEIELLKEIGFTAGESKIYLSLLEIGPTSAGKIIEHTKLQNSVIHLCLNSLIKKGLVVYILRGKRKIYSAVNPNRLINLLEDRKRRINEALPELLAKQRRLEEKPNAEVFEGSWGIMTLLDTLLDGTKKGDEYLFFSFDKPLIDERMMNIFNQHERKRKEKGLIVRGIAPKELKPLFKYVKINMRYVDFPIPSGLTIIKDKLMIITWEKEPIGFLIKSDLLTNKYREFFNHIWKISERL